ncbi:transmembrane protein, putative [Medicago truncatula]|uniref:Transmembrane protein, putative n=1 Tax=Medicago truncatula TaxID=3880 RepID=G7J7W6_MEDTR|nr:transmembrane protein, putative [Medicago truncatula]
MDLNDGILDFEGRSPRGGAWSWRRRLFAWEEDLVGECRNLLNNVTFQVHSGDHWQWNLDSVVGYTVVGAYQLLVNLCLLRNWLSTKDNLFRRGILNQDSQLCVSGHGVTKSAKHLFLERKFFG